MTSEMTRVGRGLHGEQIVYQYLSVVHGRSVHRLPGSYPYDMIVDGMRVDVKTATPRKHYLKYDLISWDFTIGKPRISTIEPDSKPDCYVLRLEEVPFSKHAIHLLMLAPVERPMIYISMRALLVQKYHKEYEQFLALTKGKLKIQRPGWKPYRSMALGIGMD